VRIARLTVYPLKSARGVDVLEAVAGPTGLEGDRHFMLVDEAGRFFTQRECPALARIVATREGDELALTTDHGALRVPWESHPGAKPIRVEVWRDSLVCDDAGDDAADLLSAHAGTRVRLVRFGQAARRPLHSRYGEGTTELADGSPVLVASLASLAPLTRTLGGHEPSIRRFRANVVIDGEVPFAEEGARELVVGGGRVVFRLVKRCPRCPIVDVDPDTGVHARGTLSALAEARTSLGGDAERAAGEKRTADFGVDSVVDVPGTLRVGDPVSLR
jgi:uncharacterized protein YcbX